MCISLEMNNIAKRDISVNNRYRQIQSGLIQNGLGGGYNDDGLVEITEIFGIQVDLNRDRQIQSGLIQNWVGGGYNSDGFVEISEIFVIQDDFIPTSGSISQRESVVFIPNSAHELIQMSS